MGSDRDRILERRALFLASALAAAGCTPPRGTAPEEPARGSSPAPSAGAPARDAAVPGAAIDAARASVPMVCLSLIIPPRIEFAWSSTTPTPASLSTLDAVADTLRDHPDVCADVEGHADSTEPDPKRLSQRRAEAAKRYLVERGIAADRIGAVGFGAERPLVADAKSGKNRRIELRAKHGEDCPGGSRHP